ncbi:MAG: hypothetical protein J5706_02145 [Elusimicrobiales bacterium]|nr:hypothetical protein [Elusimicrobiales bacterium]
MKKYFRAIGHCMAFIAAFWLIACTYPLQLNGRVSQEKLSVPQPIRSDVEFAGWRYFGNSESVVRIKYNEKTRPYSVDLDQKILIGSNLFDFKFLGNNSPLLYLGKNLYQILSMQDSSFKYPSIQSMLDMSNYSNSSRYITFVEIVKQEIDFKDNYSLKEPIGYIALSCLIFPFLMGLYAMTVTPYAAAYFNAEYNIYVFDTHTRQLAIRVPVEVKQSDKWTGGCWPYTKEDVLSQITHEHWGKIIANAIAKKYMEILPQLPKDSGISGNNQTENRRTRRTRRANR